MSTSKGEPQNRRFVGGRIYSMRTPGEVLSHVSSRGEWITPDHEADALVHEVDLGGAVMLPGFIDVHVHLEYPERYDRSLDRCTSRAELVAELRRLCALRPADAAYHRFYALLPDRQLWPDQAELDSVSLKVPLVLGVGGFVYLLNSAALTIDLADALMALPPEMVLLREEDGAPTGLVRDDAQIAVDAKYPRTTPSAVRTGIDRGLAILAECGVTQIHHMVKTRDVVDYYQELRASGRLPLRVGLIVRAYGGELPLETFDQLDPGPGSGDQWLQFQGAKFVLDGAFPGGGAAFREPYVDEPDNSGNLLIDEARFRELIQQAHDAEIRCCVHTVGDRAIDVALDAFEAALDARPRADHRHRLEHSGNIILHQDQLDRLSRLSVVAVVNPTYAYQKAQSAHLRLGAERSGAPLRVRAMVDGGVEVVAASDFSGAYPADPIKGIAFLVNRISDNGSTLAGSEAVSVWEALSMYTSKAAWAGFQEDVKGTIEAGKVADFVIVDRDPFTTPPEELGELKVLATIVGGDVVYQSANSPIDWSAQWQR